MSSSALQNDALAEAGQLVVDGRPILGEGSAARVYRFEGSAGQDEKWEVLGLVHVYTINWRHLISTVDVSAAPSFQAVFHPDDNAYETTITWTFVPDL